MSRRRSRTVPAAVAIAAASVFGCGDRAEEERAERVAASAIVAEVRILSGTPLRTVLAAEGAGSYSAAIRARAPRILAGRRELEVRRATVRILEREADVADDRADVRLEAHVMHFARDTTIRSDSREEYRVRLARRETGWVVTRIRNPSEFNPSGA